jgi:integrase
MVRLFCVEHQKWINKAELGLAELEFWDQLLLVFLEGALGIRQGELGALRWLECDFDNMSICVQHSYYWRRGGNLKSTKTEASAKLLPMHPSLKHSLQEWRSQSLYNKPEDFVFPSERLQGSKPLDLASVLKNEIQPDSMGPFSFGAYRPLTSPDLLGVRVASA